MEGGYTAVGEIPFPIAGHLIGEAALEPDQAPPINLRFAHETMAAHAPLRVDRLSATDQHLLRIAAAQRTSPTKGTVIDQRHRPARRATSGAGRPRGGAGADDHEIIGFHVVISSSKERAALSRSPRCAAGPHPRAGAVAGCDSVLRTRRRGRRLM